jgi:phosphoglycerol transferase MdoB-like AlkP superfamily enzyme
MMFAHLNFKLVDIKYVRVISTVISIPFALLFFTTMYKAVAIEGVRIADAHFALLSVFLCITIVIGAVSRRIIPTLTQIIGLVVFVLGLFLLLA